MNATHGPPESSDTSSVNDLIKKYAEVCKKIHEDNTVGDYTWEGVLATFTNELRRIL